MMKILIESPKLKCFDLNQKNEDGWLAEAESPHRKTAGVNR